MRALRFKQLRSRQLLAALTIALPIVFGGCAGASRAIPSFPAVGNEPEAAPDRKGIAFRFRTLDDDTDPHFNELLGINNVHELTGFYGHGGLAHPNRGYEVYPPYHQRNYRGINFPMSLNTQLTCLNNTKTVAGFYSDSYGNIFGFADTANILSDYQAPRSHGLGTTTELLGINDLGFAVGFYTSKTLRRDRAFEVQITTGIYTELKPPHATDAVATGINGRGDVVGYFKRAGGAFRGFLLRDGVYTFYSFPHAASTQFLGVTVLDRIVGSYVDQSAQRHGFLLLDPLRPDHTAWQRIDDPNGVGRTVVNSLNIHYELAGYYTDRSGERHGFIATPRTTASSRFRW